MFVSHGPDWSVKVINQRGLQCLELYYVENKDGILIVAGSEDQLVHELAKLVYFKQVPKFWSVCKVRLGFHKVEEVATFHDTTVVTTDRSLFVYGKLENILAQDLEVLRERHTKHT